MMWKEGIVAAIVLALCGFIFFENRCSKSRLYAAFKEEAASQLRSPSSAMFPSAKSAVTHFFNSGQCSILVNTHFDSQNGFGAMIRGKASGVAKRVDGKISAVVLLTN